MRIIGMVLALVMMAMPCTVVEAQPSLKEKRWVDIEWVALWEDPKNREEWLERMLTSELQGKILATLLEKQYLVASKEVCYLIDPFKVTGMITNKNGIYEMDVLATVKDKEQEEIRRFMITFRHVYEKGFVVIDCNKL